MKKTKVTKQKSHNVDTVMQMLGVSLVRDFRTLLVDPCYCTHLEDALQSKDVTRIRSTVPTLDMETVDTVRFKCDYQMASLFKRHRFQSDLFRDEELELLAVEKFLNVQSHLDTVKLDCVSAETTRILDVARQMVHWILGPFDREEHRGLCRFGSKASVGVPGRLACEAERWELPITGSLNQIAWFADEIANDEAVQVYLSALQKNALDSGKNQNIYHAVDYLTLAHVPKTYKSLRTIMPDTTIGSYISRGVGSMITKRLKRRGYDISLLQENHKQLAMEASIHNLWVTLDLSSASDTLSEDLVRLLLPDDWYSFINDTRIARVKVDNDITMDVRTFSTMGIGYTFPLQTLIFLCLLQAVQYTHFRIHQPKVVSVYGDDMIFHRRQIGYVLELFKEIGLIVNIDKSYYDGPFRESCGGDFHRGRDVRPFQPQNGPALVDSKVYEATLYKAINGLLRRWSEWEIGYALRFLKSELKMLVGLVKTVPLHFPDDSGVKCATRGCWSFLTEDEVVKPVSVGHGLFRFPYLSCKSKKKEEHRHEPYYWLALRGLSANTVSFVSDGSPPRTNTPVQQLVDDAVGVVDVVGALELRVTPESREALKKFYASPHAQCRRTVGPVHVKYSTYVSQPLTARYTRQSGISEFR